MSDGESIAGREREVTFHPPGALTREDVVGICLDFYGDLPTVEQRNAIVQLRDTDAALRATITQQAQELERVKERLHRYNHWTPEHTIEEWLADRQRIVDAKQVEADAQLQATLAARVAEIDRLKLAQQHSIQDECEAEQRLIDAGISDYEDGGQGEYRGLLTQIDLCIKERDAAVQQLNELRGKLKDEPQASGSSGGAANHGAGA